MSLILSCMLIPKDGKLALLSRNTFRAGTYDWIRQSLCCRWCYLVAKLGLTLVTPGTTAHQAPLSMVFPRQEYCMGCHFLLQGIFPTQGSNSHLLCLPALAGGFFTTEPPGKPNTMPVCAQKAQLT